MQRQNEELEIKNNHLNQAVHEEREAIIELRVQLRLLQTQRARAEQPEDEEPRDGTPKAKAAKEPAKPWPSRDRRETPL